MAKKTPRLTVLTTPNASADLTQIWSWNASYYDVDHADAYVRFLQYETDKLETEYANGQVVPGFPEYQYVVIRKGRGHGHIAVYTHSPIDFKKVYQITRPDPRRDPLTSMPI